MFLLKGPAFIARKLDICVSTDTTKVQIRVFLQSEETDCTDMP